MTDPPPWTETNTGASGLITDIRLDAPSTKDNRADTDRLLQALQRRLKIDPIQVELDLMRQLPDVLRRGRYQVRCLVARDRNQGWLIQVSAHGDTKVLAGLAIDLGTTRVALRLVDVAEGKILAETTFDNPQSSIGPDILTRVHFTEQPDGLARLMELIRDAINSHAALLCQESGLSPDDIYLISLAGNTTMGHLLAGLPVRWMIREPYIPAANHFGFPRAAALGIRAHTFARIFIFPNVGSYFGGDLIAGILYSGIHQRTQTAILVDVGTNAEVVLGNQDWLIGCAGAAGPALESGLASMGATAGPGVIDRVVIEPRSQRIDLHTIDGLPPKGICGSGVIDLAAQLFLADMIDIRGKFRPDICGQRLIYENDLAYLTVVPAEQSATGKALTFSQAELDSLIRSKAAMYTILETITATMGLDLSQLDDFFVAGTFGAYINPASAITLGMIPDLPLHQFHSLGNSSLEGATMVLTDCHAIGHAQALQERITYLELNINQDFMNRFSAAKFIPHTDAGRFPSVTF
jgi:uncharacterized 2Fe-2S/4Fe-4S cluster protein (DUF4445 family)